MEFIYINSDRLKVIMTKADLEEFELKAEDLDYSKVETKRMFWDIIGRAKRSVGFSCDGERVLVRLYTSRDGGCEMFISKLDPEAEDCDYLCPAALSFDSGHNDTVQKKRRGAYRFDKLEWLLSVCRRLASISYTGESSAFFDSEGAYYLFIDGLDSTGYFKFDEFSFISEYGEAESPERAYEFLCEHGKAICHKNAVDILSSL